MGVKDKLPKLLLQGSKREVIFRLRLEIVCSWKDEIFLTSFFYKSLVLPN